MHCTTSQIASSAEGARPLPRGGPRTSCDDVHHKYHVAQSVRYTLNVGIMASLMVAGCSSSPLKQGVYSDGLVKYEIGNLPDNWKRLEVEDQNDLAWIDKADGSIIQVNSTCKHSDDIPLKSLTRHLLIGFTETKLLQQDTITIAAREALQTRLIAKLDGVPRALLLVVMKKDTCLYDFALLSPSEDSLAGHQPTYQRFVSAFRTHPKP